MYYCSYTTTQPSTTSALYASTLLGGGIHRYKQRIQLDSVVHLYPRETTNDHRQEHDNRHRFRRKPVDGSSKRRPQQQIRTEKVSNNSALTRLQLATSSRDLKKNEGQKDPETMSSSDDKRNKTKSPVSSFKNIEDEMMSSSKPSTSKPSQSLQDLVPKPKKASKRRRTKVSNKKSKEYDKRHHDDEDDIDDDEEQKAAAATEIQYRKTVIRRLARASREAANVRREQEKEQQQEQEEEAQRLRKQHENNGALNGTKDSKNDNEEATGGEDNNIIDGTGSTSVSEIPVALKRQRKKQKSQRSNVRTKKGGVEYEDLPSVSALNDVIEDELLHPADGRKRPPRETESMRALLEHNVQFDDYFREEVLKSELQDLQLIDTTMNSGEDEAVPMEDSDERPQDQMSDDAREEITKETRTDKQIAVVFARPLIDGQISLEYASRLASLAKSIYEGEYLPDLICFCGSFSSRRMNEEVPDGMVGIVYFRHLCASNDISLKETNLVWIPDRAQPKRSSRSILTDDDNQDDDYGHNEAFGTMGGLTSSPPSPNDDEDVPKLRYNPWSSSSFQPIVKQITQSGYVKQWLDESDVYESEMDEYGLTREEPRKKISIHWKFISTDYDLCSLNNIHIRSPRQSPLATLSAMEERISKKYRGICVNNWSFQYTVYPFVYAGDDEVAAFLGKCYLLAQELVPVLVNIWGVAGNTEFFQKDNYSALVASRRALASLMEEMNTAYQRNQARTAASMTVPPTLKSRLQHFSDPKMIRSKTGELEVNTARTDVSISTIDIQLEGALLSLGRAADLVRPAGTFSSQPVPQKDWKLAFHHLQDFMFRIDRACDPDRELSAAEWGDLGVSSVLD